MKVEIKKVEDVEVAFITSENRVGYFLECNGQCRYDFIKADAPLTPESEKEGLVMAEEDALGYIRKFKTNE